MAWKNYVKTYLPTYVDIQISPILRGGIDWWGVIYDRCVFWFESHQKQQILGEHKIKEVNLLMLGALKTSTRV
jgi:hypothetical protein